MRVKPLTASDLVVGWKAIADAIHCKVRAAQARKDWKVDPLPVWENHLGEMCAFKAALHEWERRHFLPAPVAARVRAAATSLPRPGARRRASVRDSRSTA